MKKNLATSILLLLLAVFTCCGVTFAYFSSSQSGSNNQVTIGDFIFDTTCAITNSASVDFKDPTIINVPQITDPLTTATDYEVLHNKYLSDGDDKNFDKVAVPFTITVTNKSSTPMKISINVTASKPAADTVDYTQNGTFQSFVFDSATSKKLVSGGANAGKYADAVRAACPTTAVDSNPTNIFEQTKLNLTAGKTAVANTISADFLAAKSGTQTTPTYSTRTYIAIAWLDWRGFKTVLGNTRPSGNIIVSVTVTATQSD